MRTKTGAHGWPVDFYSNTITGNTNSGYAGFGFQLSKEGGNWDFATNAYHVGNNPWYPLAAPDENCISYIGQAGLNAVHVFTSLLNSVNVGSVQMAGTGVGIQTHSPSWTAMIITVTNSVNAITIDSQFTSTNGAQGLLSVYWDADVIGTLDERAVQPELKNYMFGFPVTTANSTHVLGFRLDPFTNIQSSIVITNIALVSVGVTEPFSLAVTTNMSGGLRVFRLTGQSGFNYMLQASTNLSDWDTIAVLVNTNGIVNFVDYGSTNYSQRFYRAVAPN
jgi:hypothetical protein